MNTSDMSNRYACSRCDKTFSRKYDMQRHEQNEHDTGEETSEDEDSDPSSQMQRVEESNDDSETSVSESDGHESSMTANMEETEDNLAYRGWLEQAMTTTEDLRDEKYQKYISEGMEEEDAKAKAHVKLLWAVKRIFFDLYSQFLQQNVYLEDADINREIVSDLTERLENGMEFRKAVQRVLARHGSQFDGLFQYQGDDDDDDGGEETEGEDGVYN